jgi:hypothetical protein
MNSEGMLSILREIRELRSIIEHLEMLIEERFIGIDDPLPDEEEEIERYEDERRKGEIRLIKLEDILGEQ